MAAGWIWAGGERCRRFSFVPREQLASSRALPCLHAWPSGRAASWPAPHRPLVPPAAAPGPARRYRSSLTRCTPFPRHRLLVLRACASSNSSSYRRPSRPFSSVPRPPECCRAASRLPRRQVTATASASPPPDPRAPSPDPVAGRVGEDGRRPDLGWGGTPPPPPGGPSG
ncbi:hypothetical protein C2845_PM01G21260 [Panicum miliaceum]|uniref:Uncharacterized protein n=1 Tax=Panicum miliaceum TaxID=4540 RepID=A0A3L6TM64_PANMI|nr:hypothetical protein C2845_PM01G21260 [Panicum miliaceum]